MGQGTQDIESTEGALTAERMVFFTDAVVAIAMTLLVLPLMESVSEADELSTAEYFAEHADQVISFGLSFTIIAGFWISHHRVWERVRYLGGPLFLLNTLWLLGIVWLPVSTAMVGQMTTDRPQIALYIGSMLLMSVAMTLVSRYVVTHPGVAVEGTLDGARRGLRVTAVLSVLYALALVVALALPGVGYYALFLLTLTAPAIRLLRRFG